VNAHVDFIDREKRVVWVSYVGRGDELRANLAGYAVDYVPSFFLGRVGLTYSRSCPEDRGEAGRFSEAAVTIISILTMRAGITKGMREEFGICLHEIQTAQKSVMEAAS
jgi:hypothetical protein